MIRDGSTDGAVARVEAACRGIDEARGGGREGDGVDVRPRRAERMARPGGAAIGAAEDLAAGRAGEGDAGGGRVEGDCLDFGARQTG